MEHAIQILSREVETSTHNAAVVILENGDRNEVHRLLGNAGDCIAALADLANAHLKPEPVKQ